jgi:hypothetical protein
MTSDVWGDGLDPHRTLKAPVKGQSAPNDAQVCGPNTLSNALLISRTLNGAISNDRSNAKLLDIIEIYRVPGAPD